jgi:endonuclease YncB( thermonuclease family)
MPLLFAILFIALAGPALAETLSGQASIVDVDTIEIHGQRIRLLGIDAPESRQLCKSASGEPYNCGGNAAFALADRIGRSAVICSGNS